MQGWKQGWNGGNRIAILQQEYTPIEMASALLDYDAQELWG